MKGSVPPSVQTSANKGAVGKKDRPFWLPGSAWEIPQVTVKSLLCWADSGRAGQKAQGLGPPWSGRGKGWGLKSSKLALQPCDLANDNSSLSLTCRAG